MPDPTKQRVTIETRDGITVYSADAWPGWQDIATTCVGFLITGFLFSVFLFLAYCFSHMFDGLIPYRWLNLLLGGIVSGGFALGWVLMLGFILLWIPYFLLYQLSPKQFWIENDCLIHRIRLGGLITRTRRIPFERIMQIKIGHSKAGFGAIYLLTAVYEMKLPKWLFVILVYWNEKFTQWPLGLVNGIPTKEEAEKLQNALLEPMTVSPICRVGSQSGPR